MREENERVKALFADYAKEEGAQLYINEMLEQLTMIKEDVLIFYRPSSRDVSACFGMLAPLTYEEEVHLFVRKHNRINWRFFSEWYNDLKPAISFEGAVILSDEHPASMALVNALSGDFEFKALLNHHLHKYNIDIDQHDITVYMQRGMVSMLEENTMTVSDLKEMYLLLIKTREALNFAWKHRC